MVSFQPMKFHSQTASTFLTLTAHLNQSPIIHDLARQPYILSVEKHTIYKLLSSQLTSEQRVMLLSGDPYIRWCM